MSNQTIDAINTLIGCNSPHAKALRASFMEDAINTLIGCNSPHAKALRDIIASEKVRPTLKVRPTFTIGSLPAASAQPPTTSRSMNATAKWIGDHASDVWSSLTTYIRTKMQRSGEMGTVEDHVQEFLARLIADDRLALFIEAGQTPKLSVLRVWAYHSAVRDVRHEGVDASLRTTRLAKTSREVSKGDGWKPVQAVAPAREIMSGDEADMTHDFMDPTAPTPEDVSAGMSRVDHVRRVLVRRGQGHILPALTGLLEGRSFAEIQARYNVSEGQLTAALRDMRAA